VVLELRSIMLKRFVLPFCLLLFASTANAVPMVRCGKDKRYSYFCSIVRSGYEIGIITSPVPRASAAGFACAGFRFTQWYKLRQGFNSVWAIGDCWYWVVRRPRRRN
jgi:hypothetical protein